MASTTAETPHTATKIVEKSLHDLDDLIQQRRLELSALRKSNRKRLNEQYAARPNGSNYSSNSQNQIYLWKTPATERIKSSTNNGDQSNVLLQTPMMKFEIKDEELLTNQTPISEHIQANGGGLHLNFQEENNKVTVDKTEFEELLNIKTKYNELVHESKMKYKQYESASTALEKEYQNIVQKCRLLSQDKNKLEEERRSIEQTVTSLESDKKILNELIKEQLKSIQKLEDAQLSVVQTAPHIPSPAIIETETDMDPISSSSPTRKADAVQEEEIIKKKEEEWLQEKDRLLQEIELLRASCDNWENNSKIAAKSAFDWEAHSSTVSQHFEELLSQWQTANASLIEENHVLKEEMSTLKIQLALASSPMNNPALTTDLTSTSSTSVLTEKEIMKLKAAVTLSSRSMNHLLHRTKLEKAFLVWKLKSATAKIQKLDQLYQTTTQQLKQAHITTASATATATAAVIDKEKTKSSMEELPVFPQLHKEESSKLRSQFKEGAVVRQVPPSIALVKKNRTGFLLGLAFFQTGFWMFILFIGHILLSPTQCDVSWDSLVNTIQSPYLKTSEL